MTNAATDLMGALEGEEVTASIPDPDQATPDVVSEWIAQINKLDAKREEYATAHKAAVAKLTNRLNDRVAKLNEQRGWLQDAVETYHRARLAQDPEAKTIHLPTGTVSSRGARDTFEIEDEDSFGQWAMANLPAAVSFPDPKIDRREARKLLKSGTITDGVLIVDGEKVPGVRAEKASEADRSFTVKED